MLKFGLNQFLQTRICEMIAEEYTAFLTGSLKTSLEQDFI